MDPQVERQLAAIERRACTLTGITLAVVAFVGSYGLMLFEGQTARPAFHFYPWLMALVFYIAGHLLAWIWLKTMLMQIVAMFRQRGINERAAQIIPPPVPPPEGVEVIKPGTTEE